VVAEFQVAHRLIESPRDCWDNGDVQVAILGPLEVRDDGGAPVVISGARLRDLIARLALAGGRPVGTGALAEAVWGEEPPADLVNALQTLVSRARRALGGPGAIEQSAAGYRLAIGPEDVDAFRFERLLAEGRTEEAMGLWRGPALADAGTFAAPHAQRLQQLQLDATVTRLAAEVARGQGAGNVAELKVLVLQHPLHEQLAGLLMRALAQAGRQADALAAYEAVRQRLAGDLGIDPGSDLQAAHLEVLRGETVPAAGQGRAGPLGAPPAPAPARTNLRAQLTSFIGREQDVARVTTALAKYRLVTLVGPGGTGKTRLASEVAAAIAGGAGGAPMDGVWLAELASVTDPGDVPQAVLTSIGLRESRLLIDGTQRGASRDARTRLLDGLAEANALLVLDNCEHLIEACAQLADALLAHCPRLRIIATSREPLTITGESLLPVAPLGQPERATQAASALRYPAVQLFAERAAAVSPGFQVTAETAGPVIDIVRRLDGMPLAIELAAARLRTLTLPEISRRLSDRFRLLTAGSRTALPRHRTLRAVVEWSWDLLTPAERLLAERFAIFPAGATPGAVAAVCAQPPEDQPFEDQPFEDQPGGGGKIDPADVDDLLSSLVDKSLLQPVRAAEGEDETRLRMLETVREYGTERLSERAELAELRRRHALYYSALMAEAAPKLTTRDQVAWLPRLQAERDNILAALRYWCDVRDGGQALTLVVALSGMTMVLGDNSEAIVDLLSQALAAADGEPVDEDLRTVGEVLYRVSRDMRTDGGKVKLTQDDLTDRVEALDPARQPLVGLLRMVYGFFLDDRPRLNRYTDEAIAAGDEWLTAATWMLRASLAENDGDHATQSAAAEEALRRFRVLGERWGLSSTLRVIGGVRVLDGDLDGGAAAFAEALTSLKELGSRDDEFQLRLQLADLVARRGDLAGAHDNYEAALVLAQTDGWGLNEVIVLGSFALFEATSGDMARARELTAAARPRITETAANEQLRQHLSVSVEAAGALVAIADGDLALAAERAAAAYSSAVAVSDMPLLAIAATASVELALARGNPALAAELLGAVAVVRGSEDPTSVQFRGAAERLRAALGDAEYEARYKRGRALPRASALPFLDPVSG
jgi:predicted ATPase/DNA-binding SARP family transcriptional activator